MVKNLKIMQKKSLTYSKQSTKVQIAMSTQIVRPDSSSHWYLPTDEGIKAFHSVPYAGKRGAAGETRTTTLGDARKAGAYPSVTNVLGILHKEFLVAYKVNQAILAALTLPRINGETEDEFAHRVNADSKEHAASAARLGSRLHEVAAAALTGSTDGLALDGEFIEGRELLPLQESIIELIDGIRPENSKTDTELSEFLISHPIGYGGTCDGLAWLDTTKPKIAFALSEAGIEYNTSAVIAMVDIKTRGSDAKKAPIYETDLLQLAAYLHAVPHTPNLGFHMNTKNTAVANIMINTHANAGKDGVWKAELVIHKREDIEKAWDAFQHAHALWCWVKNYDPKNYNNNNTTK